MSTLIGVTAISVTFQSIVLMALTATPSHTNNVPALWFIYLMGLAQLALALRIYLKPKKSDLL